MHERLGPVGAGGGEAQRRLAGVAAFDVDQPDAVCQAKPVGFLSHKDGGGKRAAREGLLTLAVVVERGVVERDRSIPVGLRICRPQATHSELQSSSAVHAMHVMMSCVMYGIHHAACNIG